jgi:hypothetical protein
MKRLRLPVFVLAGLVILLLGLLLFPIQPAAKIQFKNFETNYASMRFANFVFTNQSSKALYLPFYIANGDGTPKFIYKAWQNGKWSGKKEGPRPQASIWGRTQVDVAPGGSVPLKIILPEAPVQVGLELDLPWELTRIQRLVLTIQRKIRSLLRFSAESSKELWCPTTLEP